MNVYKVTLGNTKFTKGHKHHCAQVSVTFTLKAKSADAAREIVGKNPNDKRITKTEIVTNLEWCSARGTVVEEIG